MPNKVYEPSTAMLRSNGVVVTLNDVIVQTGDDGKETYRRAGTKKFPIRFTNATMADLEEQYGSMQAWSESLTFQPNRVLLFTFGLLMGQPREYVDLAVIMGATEEYQFAMITAYLMAMGASAEELGKLSSRASKLGTMKDALLEVAMETWAPALDDFPSDSGSEDGSDSDDPSQSSGTAPHASSDSSSTLPAKTRKRPVAAGKPKTTDEVLVG